MVEVRSKIIDYDTYFYARIVWCLVWYVLLSLNTAQVDFPGAPRVNGSMVAAFAGKPVILVGKVRSSEAGQAVL